MPRLLVAIVLLCLSALCPALMAQPALRPGEVFTYKVSWGLLGTVGMIQVQDQPANEPDTVAVSVNTRSAGLARVVYPFEGNATSFFDQHDGRLLRATAETKSRSEATSASIVFDYAKAEARYTDHLKPKRNTTLPLPERAPLELITSLISARDLNLKPGDNQIITVLFDDEFYELNLHAEAYETVRTANGKIRALRVTPKPVGEPKGMFRKGGSIRVWLADDNERLPVRFEVELKVGTAVALLSEHFEPTSGAETSMASSTTPVPHRRLLPAGRL